MSKYEIVPFRVIYKLVAMGSVIWMCFRIRKKVVPLTGLPHSVGD